MKLICSTCNCFIESDVAKVKTSNPETPFVFYCEHHIPPNSKIIKILPLQKMIDVLDDKWRPVMFRKICTYDKCNAVFITKSRTRKYCNKECHRLHFNEINMLKHRRQRATQKLVMQI